MKFSVEEHNDGTRTVTVDAWDQETAISTLLLGSAEEIETVITIRVANGWARYRVTGEDVPGESLKITLIEQGV